MMGHPHLLPGLGPWSSPPTHTHEPLRTCKICGLKVYSVSDLYLFRKHANKGLNYDRENLCKKCHNLKNINYPRHRNRDKRTKNLIKGFGTPLLCDFCHKTITKLKGKSAKALVIHSLDGNHENWNPANKVPSHRSCHVKHHVKDAPRNKGSYLPHSMKTRLPSSPCAKDSPPKILYPRRWPFYLDLEPDI